MLMPLESNQIKFKHGNNITSRSNNSKQVSSEPVNQSLSNNSTNFTSFSSLTSSSIENFSKVWILFYDSVKSLAYEYVGQPIDTWIGCSQSNPDKPGYTKGWIFNGLIPYFAPCGCYREAIWPNF